MYCSVPSEVSGSYYEAVEIKHNTAGLQVPTSTDVPGFDGILQHDIALNSTLSPTDRTKKGCFFLECHVLG